jgi:hypothetical protein
METSPVESRQHGYHQQRPQMRRSGCGVPRADRHAPQRPRAPAEGAEPGAARRGRGGVPDSSVAGWCRCPARSTTRTPSGRSS